ncbi:SoxR reducing system RseC family protein [Sulfurimonas sp. RIFOXYB12_FULL_35_9]|uniref:SoxR reducing system RseC family protein n=1 Tax=Sulfurimonas sp. RIFOXYB12_FULL_35_9 TaxID=1802256 RepID=UPI0008CACB62|nr:SoxR reducing system RseC family protein [Sulfurimonas sp. RIFOXYB12_FULL_35_9]OHE05236.1 MAG: hypothetical protein A2345_12605 [Sulfurimonas sp. RIFOXYB12_FULL_35_9]
MKRIKLLSSIGLNEQAPFKSIILVFLLIIGLGITGDLIVALVNYSLFGNDKEKFNFGLWTGPGLILLAFAIFWIINHRAKNLNFSPEIIEGKKYIISIMPSNIGLFETIIRSNLRFEYYYLIHDSFSNNSIEELRKYIIDKYQKKCKFKKIKATQNPNNIIAVVDEILEDLKNYNANKNDIVFEITPGQTISSIALYELGRHYGIDVLSHLSHYNENGDPIENSTKAQKINFEYHHLENQ